MVRTFRHAETGRTFALGRRLPAAWAPQLDLARYVDPNAPARPFGQRWESKAIHALHNPLGNDQYGDCVFAGLFKLDVEWRRNAGDAASPDPTEADALGLYARVTGFDPAKPDTDRGADLQTALAYVKAHGLTSSGAGKVAGWCAVDAEKPALVRRAIDIFGGVYTGCALPDAWLQNPREGMDWMVAGDPNPANGHCTAWFDYNAYGVICNSWGLFVQISWAAIAKYWAASAGGEVYAVFSPDWLNAATQTSPSGLDAAQLAADLAANPEELRWGGFYI